MKRNKELTPEEEYTSKILDIYNKSPYGHLDNDSVEAKNIEVLLKEYAAKAVEKYKNDLYSKLTDFGCWAADLGKGQCKEQCEKCQVEYESTALQNQPKNKPDNK